MWAYSLISILNFKKIYTHCWYNKLWGSPNVTIENFDFASWELIFESDDEFEWFVMTTGWSVCESTISISLEDVEEPPPAVAARGFVVELEVGKYIGFVGGLAIRVLVADVVVVVVVGIFEFFSAHVWTRWTVVLWARFNKTKIILHKIFSFC